MPRSFCYVSVRADSTHWPSRPLFRAAKWLWSRCLFDMCFQSAGEAGGHCVAASERGVCLKAGGKSHLAAAFVHTPVWLEKASESTPLQVPISAALSRHAGLHTEQPPCPVPSPNHWSTNIPFCLRCWKALNYSSLSQLLGFCDNLIVLF